MTGSLKLKGGMMSSSSFHLPTLTTAPSPFPIFITQELGKSGKTRKKESLFLSKQDCVRALEANRLLILVSGQNGMMANEVIHYFIT